MNVARTSVLYALLMTSVVPQIASAHEFWLQPKQFWSEPAQSVPLSLLVGHGDHSARSKIPSRRVTRFEVIGSGNDTQDLRGKLRPDADTELRFDAPGSYVVVFETDNQARSDLPADRFNAYLQAEGLTPAIAAREQSGRTQAEGSERYSRQAKTLVQIGKAQGQSNLTQALGLRLEIVPEINPYMEPRPALLPVRVMFEGKPLAGALVKMGDPEDQSNAKVTRTTDRNGRALFEMPSQGNWLLNVTWTTTLPSADEADFDTVFASLTFGLPAPARPFTASDLVTLRDIGAVAVSPDGRWAAWDQSETDLAANQVRSRLWLLDLEHAHQPRQLSAGHQPRFSADGQWIYFLNDGQLWRLPLQKGKAQQVSDFGVSIAGYALSPTGRDIAIWADVSTACNELPCELPQPVENCCGSGRGFDDAYMQRDGAWRQQQARSTLYVPHRDEWMMPEIRSRLFVMPGNGKEARSVMGRWLGDIHHVAWAADAKSLFFTLREAGHEERFSLNLDVIESRVGEAAATNLTAANAGVDTLPATSPDGRWLAYVSAGTIQLRDLATGAVTAIAEKWDASVRSIAWTADSRNLLVTARVGMDEPLFQVSLDGRNVTRLSDEGHVSNVVPLERGGAVFTRDTMLQPADLYRLSSAGEVTRLTAINADRLRDFAAPRVERFDFKGAKGATLSGWMIVPEARRERLPALLVVHDGAQAEAANSWSRRWNPSLFAAPGYAVIGFDFHHSGARAQRDQLALDDLKLGLSAVASRFPMLDLANVCIAGDGAYGGYLAYRIAGEWARQPRCVIANGGVVDATSMAYETDEPWIHQWQELSATGRTIPTNPLQRVASWRTPLLILHGERNFRVPYAQSLSAFTAAQRHDVPSRLVVFPDEGIEMQRPRNAIQWYGEVFNWLDRWLQAPGPVAELWSKAER